jgi:hypothetical protein
MISSFSEKGNNPAELSPAEMSQYPPYAAQYWVKLLKEPLPDGRNIIFKVRYETDFILPAELDLYMGKKLVLTMKDDGEFPDDKAGDLIYSTYLIEDIGKFKDNLSAFIYKISNKGYVLHFDGHQGTELRKDDLPNFDFEKFGMFEEVELSALLLEAIDCDDEIVKDRSLFITDLAVVEDLHRTYNIVDGSGTIDGAWTFGKLLENMDNGSHPDGIRGFLKDFIKSWTEDRVVNGYAVPKRDYVFQKLISPWLTKAYGFQITVSEEDWEELWDNAPTYELKINAPFKLTAIVNRIDLRATTVYGVQGPFNAGETRFIFTLIDPVTGEIPISPNQSASFEQNGIGFFDWRGLNVILEYGNPFNSLCQLQAFAQQWYDLSDPALIVGSKADNSTYKQALEAVTQQVTNAGAAPEKINGSAIHRIRTNEKLFAGGNFDLEIHDFWEQQDWEFRQFELDPSTLSWELVPVTNNPDHTSNHALNIEEDYSNVSVNVSNQDVMNWIYDGHRHQVLHGNFLMPNELISGSSIVRREQVQYYDFDRDYLASIGEYDWIESSTQAKKIRHQISVNTCYGCHAAETKTVFTHVNALKYDEPARYLLSYVDGAQGVPDESLYPNGGTDPLQLGGHSTGVGDHGSTFPNQLISDRTYFQAVSPFLTGRRKMEYNSDGTYIWEDDNIDDIGDATTNHLFYVQDQSNNYYFPYVDDQLWGFNDLERRKNHLCHLLNLSCDGSSVGVIALMNEMKMMPLPPGGH